MVEMSRRLSRCFWFFLYTKPTKHGNKTMTNQHQLTKMTRTIYNQYGKTLRQVGGCSTESVLFAAQPWYLNRPPAVALVPEPFGPTWASTRCFDNSTGAAGAEALLEALCSCKELEDVAFNDCSQIPAAAWQKLHRGCWPKMGKALGVPEEVLEQLHGPTVSEGLATGAYRQGAQLTYPFTGTIKLGLSFIVVGCGRALGKCVLQV